MPHDFAALTPEQLAWWQERADVVDRRSLSRPALVRRLVGAASGYDALLLDGSVGTSELYSDLLAVVAIRRRRRRPRIVITDATWKSGSSSLDRFACQTGMRALRGGGVTFCVLSSCELDLFPNTWGVEPADVVFTPFCITFTEEQLENPSSGGGIFTGGDTLRDYGPLLEVAGGLSVPVTIAARSIPDETRRAAPANVSIGPVPHGRFVELMRASDVVVVPMGADLQRSAGQQTYLNAMAMGKIVVVTDAPGVRDYVTDGETGLIVPPGDAGALERALSWAVDPAAATEVGRMRAEARRRSRESFGLSAYFSRLFHVVETLL